MSETYIVMVLVPMGLLSSSSRCSRNPCSPGFEARVTTRGDLGNTGRQILLRSISASSDPSPRLVPLEVRQDGARAVCRGPNTGPRGHRREPMAVAGKSGVGECADAVSGAGQASSRSLTAMFEPIWQVLTRSGQLR